MIVTTGLDPVVHADQTKQRFNGESQKRQLCMDCRVEPGNDAGGSFAVFNIAGNACFGAAHILQR
jgi:hypothetical protein